MQFIITKAHKQQLMLICPKQRNTHYACWPLLPFIKKCVKECRFKIWIFMRNDINDQ